MAKATDGGLGRISTQGTMGVAHEIGLHHSLISLILVSGELLLADVVGIDGGDTH